MRSELGTGERVLALVGPTAAGKTELSLELAERLNGEIISCDSMLVYRGMDIGTAKPTTRQRRRVTHHLIDVVSPGEDFTVADYQALAQALIIDICSRDCLPMLVGGTGLYLRAVLQDFPFIRVPPDEELRRRLRAEARERGREALHDRLREVDPEAAERIHPNDLKRVVRALEVYEKSGKPISQAQAETTVESPYDTLKLGLWLPREVVYERINVRVDHMISQGLIGEVRELLEEGYDTDLTSMQSLGYREVAMYLRGEVSLEEAVRLVKRNTRHFARRQFGWFKREPNLHWVKTYTENGEYKGARAIMAEVFDIIAGKWPELLNTGHIT